MTTRRFATVAGFLVLVACRAPSAQAQTVTACVAWRTTFDARYRHATGR